MRTELYWINGPWLGRLAISSRPRGGDWLDDEIRSWQRAGLSVIVSLLTSEESAELDLTQEAKLCQNHGLQFISFPIVDRSVPASRRNAIELIKKLDEALTAGKHVLIHCRQGIGRAALIAAGLLVSSDVDAETAFQRISSARGVVVPETAEQRKWVKDFARECAGKAGLAPRDAAKLENSLSATPTSFITR